MVHDVVTVHAAGTRFEPRRRIDVTHAEAGEVGGDAGGIAESEVLVKLQAIGCARGHAASIHQRTVQGWSVRPSSVVAPSCQIRRPGGGNAMTGSGERLAAITSWP